MNQRRFEGWNVGTRPKINSMFTYSEPVWALLDNGLIFEAVCGFKGGWRTTDLKRRLKVVAWKYK